LIPNKTPANGDVPITVEATTMLTSHNCRSNNNADDGSQEEDNVNNRDKNKATTNSDTNNFDGGFARSKALLEQNGGKTIGKKHALSNIEQEKASKKPRVRAFDFNDVLQLVQALAPEDETPTRQNDNRSTALAPNTDDETPPTHNDNHSTGLPANTDVETKAICLGSNLTISAQSPSLSSFM
jgi:hypothetical protein